MATPGEERKEGAAHLPNLCPQPGEVLSSCSSLGRGRLSVLSETVQTHSMTSTSSVNYQSSSSSSTSISHMQEPVSILGKGRHYCGSGSSSSSGSLRHTVKFSEPQLRRTPESPRWKTQQTPEKLKCQETFKYKLHEASSPNTHRSLSHGIPSIPETSATFESSNFRFQESSKLVGTSFRCPDSPRSKTRTRTPDRNSIIASMELKVPSFHDMSSLPSGGGGPGLSPLLGPPERRGLTILSPHNPTPELHFASTFTVRTRKGKTIVLPKLRIPACQSHSHDSIFSG